MLKTISTLTLLIFANINLFAQTELTSAPVNWQRYASAAGEVSVLLPKMPVLLYSPDVCSESETLFYFVYAEDTAYSLRTTRKTKTKIPTYCQNKKRFGKEDFRKRRHEIKNASEQIREEKLTLQGIEVTKFASKTSTVWLLDDMVNNRWFELSVYHRELIEVDAKSFVESIRVGNKPEGIEIGTGSPRTLGDGTPEGKPSDENISEKTDVREETLPLNIVFKAKPRYTDAARQANLQGTLILRVTFLANGGIGAITPVSELSHGLTEQAIAAAKKLVFLPQKADGKPQTVVRSVQYSFSIY